MSIANSRAPLRSLPPRMATARGPANQHPLLPLFYLVGFALNLYLVLVSLGPIPLRFVYMLAFLAVLAVRVPAIVRQAVLLCQKLLLLLAYLGAVGFALSLVRGDGIVALYELIATQLQAAVLLILGCVGVLLIGFRRMVWTYALAVAGSILFALLQKIGFGWAMSLRTLLGYTQVFESGLAASQERAPGLSFSTIILAQEACIAFALILYRVIRPRKIMGRQVRFKPGTLTKEARAIAIWSVVLFLVATLGGNRSPILGLLIFVAIYLSLRERNLIFVTLPILVGLYFLIDPVRDALGSADYRIAEVGDKSAEARWPLNLYGLRLFFANPFGYGLAFDSRNLVHSVYTGDLSVVLQRDALGYLLSTKPIHNWWIIVLNIYGIFILPAAYFLIRNIKTYSTELLLFVPYLIHISFHSTGPLVGDYTIWIAIGMIAAERHKIKRREVLARYPNRPPDLPMDPSAPLGQPVSAETRFR